jgi:toxin ParE1/3/4
MRHKIIVEPRAKTDIVEIKKWYRSQKPGLEDEFVSELNENLSLLNQSPLLFEIKHKNFRAVILKRFPYLVYYFIDKNNVHILAVLAAKQNQKSILEKR